MRRLIVLVTTALIATACIGDGAGSGADTSVTNAGTTQDSGSTLVEGMGSLTCWSSAAAPGSDDISFADATQSVGLIEPLLGMKGHAAAWGDVNGDGLADLAVGTFATASSDVYLARGATGPSPDRLLTSGGASFGIDGTFTAGLGRTSGAAFVDLDGDGDDDLVLSRNVTERDAGGAATAVFQNDGSSWTAVDSGIDPALGGRSIGVLDVDRDGLADLLVVEDRYRGGSSRLYRNRGDFHFEDMSVEWGLGLDVSGLGVATGDVNGDHVTDVFIAGSNRLFVGTGTGLREVASDVLAWESFGAEDDVSGAAIADVNRDGKPDLVVGHHYNSTLSQGRLVPVRLFLNETPGTGEDPVFRDVTGASGLTGLPTKAPHVELADFDNDGWLDVLTTASAENGTAPAIYRGTGLSDGTPRFEAPSGLGSAQYWVTGPTADYDRDGRLDVLLVEWEPSLPSLLLHNETGSGHWLEVSVGPEMGGGIGTLVEVYRAGGAGDISQLLGSREIVATLGYAAGVGRIAHFGLGDVTEVDIVITPPDPLESATLTAITVDQHLRWPAGCG